MNRVYEFAIRLNDLVSPTLQRVSQRYSGTVSRMQGLTNKFTSMFRGASQSVDELRRKLDGLKGKRDLMVDTRQIKAANREIDALDRKLKKLETMGTGSGQSGSGGWLMGMARGALPALGVAGLLAGAGSLAKSGMDREQTKVAYRQFLGEETNQRLGQLNTFANVTPYTNEEVYAGGRNLLSAKVTGGELVGKMTNIGNMAAASQKDFEEMTKSYAKIKAKGFADSGELHQEFGGTQLMEQLKQNLGVDGEGLFKMAEKRQIRFADVDKAIADLSAKGGAYEGALDKLSATAGGKLSTFIGTLQDKLATGMEKLNPFFGTLFDFGTALIGKLDPVLTVLGDGFGKLWDATEPLRELFGDLFTRAGNLWTQFGKLTGGSKGLNAVFDVLSSVVWTISKGIQWVGEVVLWLADSVIVKAVAVVLGLVKAWGFLNVVMAANPIGAVVVGIVALVSGIKYAWDHVDGFRYAMIRMWEVAKSVFGSLGAAWDAFKNGDFSGFKAALANGWNEGLANATKAEAADRAARKVAQAQVKTKPPGTQSAPGAGASTGKAGGAGVGKSAGLNATTGGTKSTSITINLKSLVETLNINSMGMDEGAANAESKMVDMLLRVLNSANAMAT